MTDKAVCCIKSCGVNIAGVTAWKLNIVSFDFHLEKVFFYSISIIKNDYLRYFEYELTKTKNFYVLNP